MTAATETKALLEALDEPALVVEAGRVVGANRAAKALFGAALGAPRLSGAAAPAELVERIEAGAASDLEISGIGDSGRPWLLSVRPLDNGRVLARLIDRSAARAAEKMRVDFVANASHELRTPLATLVGYAETLREQASEVEEQTRERFVAIIHDEARRMQRLVEDLISLSRIEAERYSPPSDPIVIEQLVEEAVVPWRGDAAGRNSELLVEVEPGLPPTTGDRNQIMQLLDNLIGNALRYGRAGTPVRIAVRRDGAMVRLTVSDQGEGIPAKHIPRITERFYRVDKARSRDSGGTGLGLSIVKHIVERHRGRLDIQSTVGRGTDVHVLLPLARNGSPATVTKA
jgi:two-component system phosphate regulon sensor histidine kinase PhoR